MDLFEVTHRTEGTGRGTKNTEKKNIFTLSSWLPWFFFQGMLVLKLFMFLEMKEGRKEVILPIAIMFLRICWCDTKSCFGIFGRKKRKQKKKSISWSQLLIHGINPKKLYYLQCTSIYIYIFYTCIIYIYIYIFGCCFNCSIFLDVLWVVRFFLEIFPISPSSLTPGGSQSSDLARLLLASPQRGAEWWGCRVPDHDPVGLLGSLPSLKLT